MPQSTFFLFVFSVCLGGFGLVSVHFHKAMLVHSYVHVCSGRMVLWRVRFPAASLLLARAHACFPWRLTSVSCLLGIAARFTPVFRHFTHRICLSFSDWISLRSLCDFFYSRFPPLCHWYRQLCGKHAPCCVRIVFYVSCAACKAVLVAL